MIAARIRSLACSACLAAALLLAGCAQLGYRDAIVELARFEPLPDAPQVRYAPGAERHAREVAALLPAAAARVEAVHGRPFRSPPVVYVCGDDACFHRFVDPRLQFSAAVVYDNRLLLAPRLFERERSRLIPVLMHELSHLHLGERRGHYTMAIPVWFHEGFASFVAQGGGADLVSDDEAWAAAMHARHFLPDEQHLPWQRRMGSSWRLSTSLFYRQALLFVRSLHDRDPQAFARLLNALQDGADFDAAFAEAYHANPARAAAAFFARGPDERQATVDSACVAPCCCAGAPADHGKP